MKLPNRIKIAGLTYNISINKKAIYDEDNNQVDGRVLIDNQEILFSFCKNAGDDYKSLIFIHELTHLLFYYSGIGNEMWRNERDVHNFSVLLHQVLKDNKIKFI